MKHFVDQPRKMDYHLHTFHSMDGRQSMDDLCAAMVRQGVEEICLTEHIEPDHPDRVMDVPPIWDVYLEEIRQMRQKYPMLQIRAGVEIGDNPLCRQRIDDMLDPLPLDFRLLSLHLVDGKDCWYKDYYEGRTRSQAYRAYAEAKAKSVMSWDNYDSVAHIGYVAKFSPYEGEERPLRYEDAPDAFDALLRSMIGKDKCIEINTSGYGTMSDPLPHSTIIKRYIDLGGQQFTFGSDSHNVERDYLDVERAKELVRSLGGKYQASFCQREKTLYRL